MSKNKLTVSLVTWNGGKYLPICLDSLLKQTFQDFFLLVIDNGSADDTIEIIDQYVDKFPDRMRFIKNKDNVGFAKAHNSAIHWSDSDYIMLLNQDIMLEDDYLEKCVKKLDCNDIIGAVSGKILKWDFEFDGSLKKSEKTDSIDSLGLKIFKSQRVIEQHVGEKDEGFDKDTCVFGVSGTVPVYRRKALDSVRFEQEYLDEDFFSYKEDIDLAYRLTWAGWSSWIVVDAVAFHDRSAKSMEGMNFWNQLAYRREKNSFINYHSYKNHFFVLKKNLAKAHALRYGFYIKTYEIKKFLYILMFEIKTLRSLVEYFQKRAVMAKKRMQIMSSRKISNKQMAQWFH